MSDISSSSLTTFAQALKDLSKEDMRYLRKLVSDGFRNGSGIGISEVSCETALWYAVHWIEAESK